jgi:LacI family transcriptional regulator, galactose operon repressor
VRFTGLALNWLTKYYNRAILSEMFGNVSKIGGVMGNPTIRDVAKRAGVGVGTVSRVLNNSQQVSPETRERVQDAIRALDFRRNRVAQQLPRGQQVKQIGVILPFLTVPSFIERLRGVQIALSERVHRYELILYTVSTPEHCRAQYVLIASQGMVEGLLVMTLNLAAEERAMLQESGITLVSISDRCPPDWPCVGVDNVAGGRLATEYLLNLGHVRVAYVGDEFPNPHNFPTSEAGEDRFLGYQQMLAAHGVSMNPEYIRLGRHGQEVAKQLTHQLLALPEPPTAIFAMSDVQALGCLSAIREAGLHVPEDVSVIGFDDIEISAYVGLTTVRQHLEDSGRLGMDYLLRLLSSDGPQTPPQLPPLEVQVRQTTAPPGGV